MSQELRDKLIDCYIQFSISKELSEWLQDLGQIPTGTVEQKLARIRQFAGSLTLAAETFPRQTIFYLSQYTAPILAEICQELGVDSQGSKEALFKRIYREVGWREGWLQAVPEDLRLIIKETFLPILKSFEYEKDYYVDFSLELSSLLGEDHVHVHWEPAHGRALIVVVIPEFLQEAHALLLQEELKQKGLDLG
jgi:hypothetical protein